MENKSPERPIENTSFLFSATDLCLLAAESSTDLMLAIDRQHRMVWCNRSAEKALGHHRAQLLRRSFFELLPQAAGGLLPILDTALAGGHPAATVSLVSGGTRHRWSCIPLTDERGAPHGALCIAADESALARLEQRNGHLERAVFEKDLLLLSRAQLAETIIDASPDMIFVFDRHLRFCAANKSSQHYSNRQQEELLGVSLTTAFPQLAGSPFFENLVRALEGNDVALTDEPCILKKGKCNITMTPLSYSGYVYGALVIAHLLS